MIRATPAFGNYGLVFPLIVAMLGVIRCITSPPAPNPGQVNGQGVNGFGAH